jgi:hypothetical protein
LAGFGGLYQVLSGFIGFYPGFIHRTTATATHRHRRAVALSCDGDCRREHSGDPHWNFLKFSVRT